MLLSEKLKQSRKDSKLTLATVADRLSINVSTLTRYENGKTLPPLDKLRVLSTIYNVPLGYLVTDSASSMKQWISSLSPTELQALQEFINEQLRDNQQ
ncbi:MAG TPA: helix-turn-helix domain-containing protein [Candidatus Enterococcus stercoravium]|nr:helix-turn-helix domain-containing protein [Candidatus Enterococcus stercoravium]